MDNEIKLTLDPAAGLSAEAAAAVAQAPKAPELSLGNTAAEQAPQSALPALDESQFTESERKVIDEFSKKIDITDSAMILSYGSAAQKKISDFSDTAIGGVRNKDFGEVGGMITSLIANLKDMNEDAKDDKKFLGIFRNTKRKIRDIKLRYDKCEDSVNSIVSILEQHQITLLKDISMFDELYDMNLSYFKELSMYIVAGKKKLEHERATTLVELTEKAKTSGLPEDAQAANDFAEQCVRFERKLHDLELTRMVSIQMSPQIRLVQNNDTMMTEPDAVRGPGARAERGVVDIETLTKTNEDLISTLDEIQNIQKEGREKRAAAEAELGRIENELKAKLINLRQ